MLDNFKYNIDKMTKEQIKICYDTDLQYINNEILTLNIALLKLSDDSVAKAKKIDIEQRISELNIQYANLKAEKMIALL